MSITASFFTKMSECDWMVTSWAPALQYETSQEPAPSNTTSRTRWNCKPPTPVLSDADQQKQKTKSCSIVSCSRIETWNNRGVSRTLGGFKLKHDFLSGSPQHQPHSQMIPTPHSSIFYNNIYSKQCIWEAKFLNKDQTSLEVLPKKSPDSSKLQSKRTKSILWRPRRTCMKNFDLDKFTLRQ
jgi:hypothetical protein